MYLEQFVFPDAELESDFLLGIRRTCYNTYYPFQILPRKGLRQLDFEPITILSGGNGSGKTTALNVMAEKLSLQRETLYNRSSFYEDYIGLCKFEGDKVIPHSSSIITSDDVFDYMLHLRAVNDGVDVKREALFEDYLEKKYTSFQMSSLDDYEKLRKVNKAKSKTQSKFVKEYLPDNIRTHSNGESAFRYFIEKIQEGALYLLDEPENSLSVERQLELKTYLEASARYYNCQFVIATHSPILLSLKGAKIYDMDEDPVDVKRWTQIQSIRQLQQFFEDHASEF